MNYLHGRLLPVTQIARSLSNQGVSPLLFNTAELVAELKETLENHRAVSQ
jgi:hypothetical protein